MKFFFEVLQKSIISLGDPRHGGGGGVVVMVAPDVTSREAESHLRGWG